MWFSASCDESVKQKLDGDRVSDPETAAQLRSALEHLAGAV